jgi:hypothetical protein
MIRIIWLACLLPLTVGCVERRFVITTEPMGAVVYRNNQPLTPTPSDDHFIYYGKYRFMIVKDGYQTLHVEEDINPPWYQYPFIAFAAENLWPFRIRDVRRLHYQLQPLQKEHPDAILQRGIDLRARAKAVVSPEPTTPVAAPNPQ